MRRSVVSAIGQNIVPMGRILALVSPSASARIEHKTYSSHRIIYYISLLHGSRRATKVIVYVSEQAGTQAEDLVWCLPNVIM